MPVGIHTANPDLGGGVEGGLGGMQREHLGVVKSKELSSNIVLVVVALDKVFNFTGLSFLT